MNAILASLRRGRHSRQPQYLADIFGVTAENFHESLPVFVGLEVSELSMNRLPGRTYEKGASPG